MTHPVAIVVDGEPLVKELVRLALLAVAQASHRLEQVLGVRLLPRPPPTRAQLLD